MNSEQKAELRRLAGLMATARCRKMAMSLGHPGYGETNAQVEARVSQATADYDDYLMKLLDAQPMPKPVRTRSTHTVALLEVSQSAYDEIAAKLKAAGYDHALHEGCLDMCGIALTPPDEEDDAPLVAVEPRETT